jgi:hypothetical protein
VQNLNASDDIIASLQEAEITEPLPTYSQLDYKRFIGMPIVAQCGQLDDQVVLVIPEYDPGNLKYDAALQLSRCELMILTEKVALVGQVLAVRMLKHIHSLIKMKSKTALLSRFRRLTAQARPCPPQRPSRPRPPRKPRRWRPTPMAVDYPALPDLMDVDEEETMSRGAPSPCQPCQMDWSSREPQFNGVAR